MRKPQKPGFSQYFSSPNQKLVETRFLGPMRKRQKPGFYRYFSSPNQKLIETRFLAPCVNNKYMSEERHEAIAKTKIASCLAMTILGFLGPMQFLACTICVNNKYMSLRALSEAIAKTKIASFLAMTILGFLGLDAVSRLHNLRK